MKQCFILLFLSRIFGMSLIIVFGIIFAQDVIDYGGPFRFIENIDTVLISPKNGNYTNCFSEDPLPEGLVFDSLSCSVHGIPSSLVSNLTINIISGDSAYGSFLLTITRCSSNPFEILRTYGQSSVYFELFTVQDTSTGETLVNVTAETPKKAGSAVSYRFCRSTTSLRIVLASTVYSNWYVGSKLEVFSFLPVPHQKDLLLRCRMDTLAGMPTVFFVDPSYAFNLLSTWKYHFDSLPASWETSTHVSWPEGTMDSFPFSTNQIQLYKLHFLTKDQVSGSYELRLRYQDGCIVFLNGIEVFRDQLPPGEVTNTTICNWFFASAVQFDCFTHYEEGGRDVAFRVCKGK